MKIIKNYKGGNLNEKACKILFKYKGASTMVIDDEESLNEIIELFEKTYTIETILTYVDFLLQQLNSFLKKNLKMDVKYLKMRNLVSGLVYISRQKLGLLIMMQIMEWMFLLNN